MLNFKNISKRWVSSLPIYQNFKFATFGKFNFSSYDLEVPTIDSDKFINKSQGWEQECKIAAECLHDTGILVVKDKVIFYLQIIFREQTKKTTKFL